MDPMSVFRKVLSLNDTGETGAHVAGLLVPRTELAFFPPLNAEEKNPRAEILATDPDGRPWPLNFIYYNNEFFGGTRNEYRLTGLTAFFAVNGLRAGDAVVLQKTPAGMLIRPEKAADVEQSPLAHQQWLSLSGTAPETTASAPEQSFHGIRPAARLIHTIGQNLIEDAQAAVIELVKNAYDADAHTVIITFKSVVRDSVASIRIIVEDDGHGMTYEQVTDTWLVCVNFFGVKVFDLGDVIEGQIKKTGPQLRDQFRRLHAGDVFRCVHSPMNVQSHEECFRLFRGSWQGDEFAFVGAFRFRTLRGRTEVERRLNFAYQ